MYDDERHLGSRTLVDLLQVAQLPPFLTERLEKEFTLHDFFAPDDPGAMLDEIAPKFAASRAA